MTVKDAFRQYLDATNEYNRLLYFAPRGEQAREVWAKEVEVVKLKSQQYHRFLTQCEKEV